MLKADHFSSSYNFEFGARKRNYGYYPRSEDDLRAWYGSALSLCKALDNRGFGSDVRRLVARRFEFLANRPSLTDELIELGRYLAFEGGWPEGWVAVRKASRRAKVDKRREAFRQFQELARDIEPRSLKQRITTYVLPDQWSALDTAEFDLDDSKKYQKALAPSDKNCSDIGRDLALDERLLLDNLSVLISASSQRATVVGKSIGQHASAPEAVWSAAASST